VLLSGCSALAYLAELPGSRLVWLLVLVAAAALAVGAEQRGRFGTAARAIEALVCTVAIHETGQQVSPFLPYLVAPAFAGGLYGRSFGAVSTVGIEAAGLLVDLAFPAAGTRSREFSSAIAEWATIALLGGMVAAWLRRLQDSAERAATTSYTEAHRLLSQLYAVTRHLPGSLDPVTTATALLDEIAGIAPYDCGAVLVRTGGDRLVAVAHLGGDRLEWDVGLRGDNPFAEAWASELPQTRDARFSTKPDGPAGRSPGSAMVVPLRIGVRLFGLVGLETTGAGAYPADVVERTVRLVDEAALRLDTGLLFDEVREVATAEERRRLAREIHDGIAQELASLGYAVDELAATASAGSDQALVDDLARLRQEITRLIRELRLSIFELRSDVDRHGGLGAALSDHIQTIGTTSGFTVHLTLDEAARRLPAETEAELLRIAQEAINNSRKHSQADNLWVTCRVNPPWAQLIVEDDGLGLGSGRHDSFGVEIMRERAARLRARLVVQAREPRGTHVEVTLGPAPNQQGAETNGKLLRAT